MLLSHGGQPVAAIVPLPKTLDMMSLHTERINATYQGHAPFQHIDLEGIQHVVDERPEVLLELLRLALSSSREQIKSVNCCGVAGDAPAQRLAIHNLLNTFNFLRAKKAALTARRAERYVAASYAPLGPIMLTELNAVYDDVEAELSALLIRQSVLATAV
jgi:hypothetical protein